MTVEERWQAGALGNGRRLVFVGGAPRSGTTLVQNILDTHPHLLGTPELLHLPEILTLRSRILRSLEDGLIDFFCDRPAVDRATCDFIGQMLGPVVAASDARLISEKTPSNVLVFRDLAELLPEARFVFVVRDPRAVVSSMLRVGERAVERGAYSPPYTHDVRAAIRAVRQHMDAGFSFAAMEHERCCTVRFEDVLEEPRGTTKRLCDFLGLDWYTKLLEPEASQHAGEKAITATGIWYDRRTFQQSPDPDRVHAWTETLPPGHQLLVTRAFAEHPGLREVGYRLSMDHHGPRRRLTARLEWAWGGVLHRISDVLASALHTARRPRPDTAVESR